jgi:hypothetical protein
MIKIPPINYKEIFDAWKVSFKPAPWQEELANKRLDVCLKCEFRKEKIKGLKWSALCGKCGCPLSKKVFSPLYDPCPLKKWGSIDSLYLKPLEDKNTSSII